MTQDRDIFRSASNLSGVLSSQTATEAVVIRPATFGDLWGVSRLQKRAFRPPLAYGLTAIVLLWLLPNVQFLVAKEGETPQGGGRWPVGPEGGRIVGCAIGDRKGDQSRIINICVDPDTRRRGIGTQLLAQIEQLLPHGNLILMVEETNADARRLYQRAGFIAVGTGRDYYGRGQHGIWMQKQRTPSSSTTPKMWF
jgi:ribosomal-protein-alanine N-acetyltransferase